MATLQNMARPPTAESSCKKSGVGMRNLVVCIDGTSNRFGTKNTNIVELYSQITKCDQQLTYYSSGLGTSAEVAGASPLSNGLDMAFGRNLHVAIMASYRWLSNNYQDGDKIFLFGYSRGAYQARALAGMISRVGLILPGNDEQIPFAFELYSKTGDDASDLTRTTASVFTLPSPKESKKKTKYSELAETFHRTFCRSKIHVHFVGVWDTVSSVGFGRSRMFPCTTTSCEHIYRFRHALALDERRVKFLPEYVYGGRSGCSDGDDERIKEVWFPGCHADVGGGNRRNERLQSGDMPLLWMRNQAIAEGLIMDSPSQLTWKIDDLNKQIRCSLNRKWWPMEVLPIKRLLYYNSDRQTRWPHLGEPRRILPGQKVHVSALFKNNYKPSARFYCDSTTWPEPMLWNDTHRLGELPESRWEKNIFDKDSVQTLLRSLKQGEPDLNALDRLAFMAGFQVCKDAIHDFKDAEQIIATILCSENKRIRLSAAVIYCELGWAHDRCLETSGIELGRQITEDISELLKNENHEDRRRACTYLPPFCKWSDLRSRLVVKENLQALVRLCDSTRVGEYNDGNSIIPFYSAYALSTMMKLDPTIAQSLIDIQVVTDITEGLRSNGGAVLAPVLTILEGLAQYESGRSAMKAGPIVATVLRLFDHSDDFVASAATRVLCSILSEADLRGTMLRFGVLTTFMKMLDRSCSEMKEVACQALVKFARYEDVQRALSGEGHLQTLAKRLQNLVPRIRDGAVAALVQLSGTQVGAAVTDAIIAANTIHVLVTRLRKKSTSLAAASVLARLVKIDNIGTLVSNDESGARAAILNMVQRRWFDRLRQEDGLQILIELLKCDPLQSTVLGGAATVLEGMTDSTSHEDTYAGLYYLRAIARLDEEGPARLPREILNLVPQVASALHIPHRRVQRIATETLRSLFEKGVGDSTDSTADLRGRIIGHVLDLLRERQAHVVFAASSLLSSLAKDEPVRDRVAKEEAFQLLSDEYYNGLKMLEYDVYRRGPRVDEVQESIGHMITLVRDRRNADRAA